MKLKFKKIIAHLWTAPTQGNGVASLKSCKWSSRNHTFLYIKKKKKSFLFAPNPCGEKQILNLITLQNYA